MGRDIDLPTRQPRASRRRPDAPPPKVEKIRPKSGLSRAEVVANQRHRIFSGLADALEYHGYEDTKITDIVEFAGVSRATFYEHFQGKDPCFAAAYEDGVERLSAAVEAAVSRETEWASRVSAGLGAGLEFLAADPPLAHLLLVESLAASRPARLEHERSLVELAEALRLPVGSEGGDGGVLSEETARLLAGGIASLLSARVLAGEAKRLPESHDLLLEYLLAPLTVTASSLAQEQAGRA
jgi:AcrR family transcriptional regulator